MRQNEWSRNLIRENVLSSADFIWPIFIREENVDPIIQAMPGVVRLTIPEAILEIKEAIKLGINAIALFPCVNPHLKSEDAKEALNPDNLICRALKEIHAAHPDVGLIADVALDPYTTHGHDGIVLNDHVANDPSVEILCQQAVLLAKAGAKAVAPSDMMDGRIGRIREALDQEGMVNTCIFSYAVKYASAFYGPFRNALGSDKTLKKQSKASYQLDPANMDEAMREIALDIQEGADTIIIKPGLPYLDVIRECHHQFSCPIHAYQVSGEFSMLKAASQEGFLDYEKALLESLIAFKRAGACGIWTYAALEAAKLLDK
jgi:porphobilinogen synthase